MAEDAIRLVLEDSLARGEPLPNGEGAKIREVMVTLARVGALALGQLAPGHNGLLRGGALDLQHGIQDGHSRIRE